MMMKIGVYDSGIGGLSVNFGSVTITEVASALILGIITNLVLRKKQKKA